MSKKMWRPQKVGPSRRPDPVVIPEGFKITKLPSVARCHRCGLFHNPADHQGDKPLLSKRARDKAARKAVRAAHRAGAVPTVAWPSKPKRKPKRHRYVRRAPSPPVDADAICKSVGVRLYAQMGLLQVIEHAGMWAVAYSNGTIIKDGLTNENAWRFIDRETRARRC